MSNPTIRATFDAGTAAAAARPNFSLSGFLGVAALVSAAATAAVLAGAVAGVSPDAAGVNLFDNVALLFALIASIVAAHRTAGDMRSMWVLFSVGIGFWMLGEFVFDFRLLAMRADPVNMLSNALYMSFYPLMIAGLWVRDRQARPAGFDPRLLDSVVIALATTVIAYGLVYDNAAGPQAEAIGAAGRIAYPLLDGLLVWAVAYQFYSRDVTWDATRTLLTAAVISMFAAGLIFTLVGRLESGIAVSLAMTLIGLAALATGRAPRYRLTALRNRGTHAPEAILFLAFIGVGAIVLPHLYAADPTMVALAGATTGVLVLRLITVLVQNDRLLDASERRASTDSLTGLANRQHFHQRLDAEIARAGRDDGRVALLMIDLDHFKAINDIAGHAAGDRVLIAVARVLEDCCREFDVTCRVGGDEMAVIAPDAEVGAALEIAERLCHAVDVTSAQELGDLPPVSLSIGCSVFPDLASDAEGLLHTADEALYRAKRAGRATAQVYSPTAPHPESAERQLARVQAELAARDADFKAVFRHAIEAMAIFDESAKLLLVNDAAATLFGQPREAMIGRRLSHFMRADGPNDLNEMLGDLLAEGRLEGRTNVTLLDGEGRERHARIEYSTALFAPNRFLAILWDVTEAEAAADQLSSSEQRFRAIFESSIDPIFVTDDEGVVRDANHAAAEMAGVPIDDLVGSNVGELVHPEDMQEVENQVGELRDLQSRRGTFKTRDEDDVLREFEYSAVADFVPGLHLSIVRESTNGRGQG